MVDDRLAGDVRLGSQKLVGSQPPSAWMNTNSAGVVRGVRQGHAESGGSPDAQHDLHESTAVHSIPPKSTGTGSR